MFEYTITEEMRKQYNFNMVQCHAKLNIESFIQMQLFQQKNNRVAEFFELLDPDADIIEAGEKIIAILDAEQISIDSITDLI